MQKALEKLARERAETLGADMSVAMVVVDNATGEVLARVASPDYFDARRAGAGRSDPGGALAGLGAQAVHLWARLRGRADPSRDADRGPADPLSPAIAPENFDLTFQGTVTVRRALQQSLNVPAVAVLDAVGPSRLIARLAEAGAPLVLPKSEAPGLALGLGGVGVRLTDLTMLYAGLGAAGHRGAAHRAPRRDRRCRRGG